jgi:hypothetical protein
MKNGILYCLSNYQWNNCKKCGVTTIKLQNRISTLQTSLMYDCEIVNTTDDLQNPYYYEYLLKKLLTEYRYRINREFYNVEPELIQEIFNVFNMMNRMLNTETMLNNYIEKYDNEYYQRMIYKNKICIEINDSIVKRKYNKMSIEINNSSVKKKPLYVDTS